MKLNFCVMDLCILCSYISRKVVVCILLHLEKSNQSGQFEELLNIRLYLAHTYIFAFTQLQTG